MYYYGDGIPVAYIAIIATTFIATAVPPAKKRFGMNDALVVGNNLGTVFFHSSYNFCEPYFKK
jgi:hypothetical protein